MTTDADPPFPPVPPRPGVVTTLGILNVVFSSLILIGLLAEVFWLYGAARIDAADRAAGGTPSLMMMGMTDRRFALFCAVDAATGIALNLAMLAGGVALLNRLRWGARLWKWTAGIKIARLLVLGGVFVVAVSPSLAESMARSVTSLFKPGGRGRGPQVGDLIWAYSVMNLIMAVGMVVAGSIYPALSLWILGRPGIQAALVGPPPPPEAIAP